MINPTTADVGRRVLYRPRHSPDEAGVITSFNDSFVFVRYGDLSESQATMHEDLHWVRLASLRPDDDAPSEASGSA